MQEVWKQYQNTEYGVSNLGNVKSFTGYVFKPYFNSNGYPCVTISGVTKTVHRMVAETFIPNKDPKALTVNHISGIKTDNNINNLEWLSTGDNIRHAYTLGLYKVGSETQQSILTEEDVIFIKQLFIEYKLDNVDIGKMFGVCAGTISEIRQLRAWKQVLPNLTFKAKSPNMANEKKLNGEDIPIIRALREQGRTNEYIGNRFNVSRSTISAIIRGKTWKNY